MSMRSSWLPATVLALVGALLGALLGTLLTATPAQAAYTTTTQVSTPRPGHVVADVTTDAPYAAIHVYDGAARVTFEYAHPVDDGRVSLDELTWGLRSDRTYTARVLTCPTQAVHDPACEATDGAFTPSDVAPEVEWRADRAIGPGEMASVTIDDPAHSPHFGIVRSPGASPIEIREGFQTFVMPEGTWTVSLERCTRLGCNPLGLTAEFVVDRHFSPREVRVYPIGAVHPDDSAAPDASVRFAQLEGASTYTLDWHLVEPDTGDSVFAGTRVEGVTANSKQVGTFPLDLTGAPDGRYRLVGEVSYDSPHFGRVATYVEHASVPRVDTIAPTLTRVRQSTPVVHPYRGDHYLNDVIVKLSANENRGLVTLEVFDKGGSLVADERVPLDGSISARWDGRDEDNVVVPVGDYTMRVRAVDEAGNTTVQPIGRVEVRKERVRWVQQYVTKTVAAATVDRWTGPCAAITKGGSRHWSGGLGLVSDARCTAASWRRSGAAVVLSVPAPRGWLGGQVSIDVTGGAARAGSRAVGELWSPETQGWVNPTRFASSVGRHGWHWTSDHYVANERLVVRVSTIGSARYDLGKLAVAYEGAVLR